MKVHPPAIEARIKVSRLRRELIILINELTPGTVAMTLLMRELLLKRVRRWLENWYLVS